MAELFHKQLKKEEKEILQLQTLATFWNFQG